MRSIARLSFFAAAILAAAPAAAGLLRVDPVQISVDESRRIAAVTVINAAAEPVMIRAYPLAWSQADGEDVYSETDAIIVSPPIVTIPAGAKQIVRLGFRKSGTMQSAWRLIIEEVPQPEPDRDGIQVALRLNLPMFAQLKAGKAEDLRWSAWQGRDGIWRLEAYNPTGGHVRIEPADFSAASGVRHSASLRLGVVLPSSRRRWLVGSGADIANREQFQRIARRGDADERLASHSPRN